MTGGDTGKEVLDSVIRFGNLDFGNDYRGIADRSLANGDFGNFALYTLFGMGEIVVDLAAARLGAEFLGFAVETIGSKLLPDANKASNVVTNTNNGKKVVEAANDAAGSASKNYSLFNRTHPIGGNSSSQFVKEVSENMSKKGWNGPPIQVAEINEQLYILDGHHRFAAAQIADIPIQYEIVPLSNITNFGYKTLNEIIWAACETGVDKIKF
jgi:hypothetical protein